MFKNKNLVEEHYKLVHKESILDWSNSNFMNKCQTCFEGPFPTFKHLVKHLGEEHEASIETYLKRRSELLGYLILSYIIIIFHS